ncbi:MAG: oligosaccharide repeat unit polymerase [Intestinibacter bartlettii]|uniref:oligosaccharide repeat unit polymerase n=1 Tax=Intestinibacter bartlettii TaxID=261299 RepID=UPI0039A1824B
MIYIIILISLGAVCIRQVKYKDAIICPLTLFLVWYTLCLFGAYLHLDRRNELSNEIMLYNLVSIIFVIISWYFTTHIKRRKNNRLDEHIKYYRVIRRDVLYILSIVVLGYSIIQFFGSSFNLYMSGMSTAEIRAEHLGENSIMSNPLASFVDGSVFGALRIALMVIVTLEWFNAPNRDTRLLVINAISIVIRSFTGSDRLYLFDFIVVLVICFIFYKKRTSIIKRKTIELKKRPVNKIGLILVGILAVSTIIFMTNERQGDIGLLYSIYGNFTCGFQIFDTVLEKMQIADTYTFGITTFSGFIVLINIVLAVLNLPQITLVNEINRYDVPFWNIGGRNFANGYLPYIAHFYLDAGIIGIIIGSIIFGSIIGTAYRNVKVKCDAKYDAYFMMSMLLTFRTTLRWYYTRTDYCIALLYIFLLYKFVSQRVNLNIEK